MKVVWYAANCYRNGDSVCQYRVVFVLSWIWTVKGILGKIIIIVRLLDASVPAHGFSLSMYLVSSFYG